LHTLARKFDHYYIVLNILLETKMPAALHSRSEVIALLLTTFRNSGYDGTSLADLAAATGLGRSSLYHHFPGGKEEMAIAVFDFVDEWLDQNIVKPSKSDDVPTEKLARVIEAINIFYEGGQKSCFLGAFAAAHSGQQFQQRLSAAFQKWIDTFALIARESGVSADQARQKACEAVMMVQGGIILAGAMGSAEPFKKMMLDMPQQLLKQVAF
jgi:TetR/AcrR family transcriptional regulator, lmrAB and yxaGH operons repressor